MATDAHNLVLLVVIRNRGNVGSHTFARAYVGHLIIISLIIYKINQIKLTLRASSLVLGDIDGAVHLLSLLRRDSTIPVAC